MRGPDGAIVMDFYPNGAATAQRARGPIPPAPPPVAMPRETLGLYVWRYAVDGGVLTIAFGPDGGLTWHMGQIGPVRLRAISQTEFEEGLPVEHRFPGRGRRGEPGRHPPGGAGDPDDARGAGGGDAQLMRMACLPEGRWLKQPGTVNDLARSPVEHRIWN